LRTLGALGLEPVATTLYPDHHAYSREDAEELASWAAGEKLDCLLTTEKDAVKLARLQVSWPVPVVSVMVSLKMLADGDTVLGGLIDRMLAEHEAR